MKLIKRSWRGPLLILDKEEKLAYEIGLHYGRIHGFAAGVITTTVLAFLLFLL